MKENNVVGFAGREQFSDALTELLRTGARQLIQEAELSEFMSQFAGRVLTDGWAVVIRNGYHPERKIQTGIGPITVKIPKVRSRKGVPISFRSALVPPVNGHL